ncbi:MAG: hypothetical protein ACREBG_23625 [Pyrinomonadaceae bacterium]
MYCSFCGIALAQPMKFCNRCGGQLITAQKAALNEPTEKRLYEESVDLFWVTVIGLGMILGGIVLLRKVLNLSEGLIIAYMILSSTAFAINLGLSLWQISRLARISKEARSSIQLETFRPQELSPERVGTVLLGAPSVTENTTRTLDSISEEHSRHDTTASNE